MTEHDSMAFLDGLREHLAGLSAAGEGAWPTPELMTENLKGNVKVLGAHATSDFAVHLVRLRSKGWVVVETCSPGCHAKHIKLTAAGLAALKWMNEKGCSVHRGRKTECHVGKRMRFKEERAA